MADHYKTLGVDRNASESDIKKAYRRLARKYHPDVNPNDAEAERRFKEINEAYQVLGDADKKSKYDQFGDAAFNPGAGGNHYGGGGFDVGDLFGQGGMGDIFDVFLGGQRGGRSARQSRPARGEDIYLTVNLSFDEAFHGVTKDISYNGYDSCTACGGTGTLPGTKSKRCDRCNGTGQTRSGQGLFGMISQPCPSCGGTGQTPAPPCPTCGGRGARPAFQRVNVKIPAGADNESRIRVAGKGHPGTKGAPHGDLIIVTAVAPHPLYERKGNNLYIEVPVTVVEAALGTRIEVPTPEGKVSIHIPEGTENATSLRLRGRGFPALNSRARGDLYVKVKVVTPRKLSQRAKDILKDFAQSHPEDPRAALYDIKY